jgi:hypothetical protein
VLWFQVDDFDAAVARARGLGAEIVLEPHVNPNPQTPRDLAARFQRLCRGRFQSGW